jgi:AcrR family transcriptional regulator
MTQFSALGLPSKLDLKRGRPVLSPEKAIAMKAQIAMAARVLFLNEGYQAVSMRRIASVVGCAPMSLYKYYPAKIDILRYLWADILDKLFSDLAIIEAAKEPPLITLISVSRAYVHYWLNHPDHYHMVFMSEGVTQPDVSVFVEDDYIAGKFQLFFVLVAKAKQGETEAVKLLAESLICALNGVAHCLVTISGLAWSSPDLLVETIVTAIVQSQTS